MQDVFTVNEVLSNDITSLSNDHTFFGQLSRNSDRFGLRLGVRSKYTDRQIKYSDLNQNYEMEGWTFNPRLSLNWKISSVKMSLTLGNSKMYPFLWQLSPIEVWVDANNVNVGNPTLVSQQRKSYNLGFDYPFRRNLLSLTIGHNRNKNSISSIQSLYSPTVMLSKPENIDLKQYTSCSVRLSMRQINWLSLNLSGKVSYSQIRGEINNVNIDREGGSWGVSANSIIKLGKSTRFSISSNVNGSRIKAQGSQVGGFITNLGFSQDFLDKKLKLSVRFGDVFRTTAIEHEIDEPGFYSYSNTKMDYPVTVNLRYNFNNYKDSGTAPPPIEGRAF